MRNYVGGEWVASTAADSLPVLNPATGEQIGTTPLSTVADVSKAIDAASRAFPAWRRTPVTDRVQFLFKLKTLLEQHFDDISRTITLECGKTLAESRGEMRRAVENVDVACGTPILIQGYNSEDIAAGIDEIMIRQPLGVCAVVAPFNFPGMIPFWFLPYAIACGNTVVLKPSERVPLTMQKVFELVDAVGLPAGVLNLVNGGRDVVNTLAGSSCRPIASASWAPARSRVRSMRGRRPPANARSARAARKILWSSFRTRISRLLPTSSPTAPSDVPANDASRRRWRSRLAPHTIPSSMPCETGLSPASSASVSTRASRWGRSSRRKAGRACSKRSIRPSPRGRVRSRTAENSPGPAYSRGNFVGPTVIDGLPFQSELTTTEIFGPVLSAHHVDTVEDAIALVNTGSYGNQACLFTTSGANARKFRHEAEVGNIGINIAVAAPMAFFPFSGARESFFGDLHGQGRDAVEFFTQEKVVVERWPASWTRRF